MEKIKLAQASRLTSPNPVTVVCTEKPDGCTNLATVSWWTYLSFNPDMVAFAMRSLAQNMAWLLKKICRLERSRAYNRQYMRSA